MSPSPVAPEPALDRLIAAARTRLQAWRDGADDRWLLVDVGRPDRVWHMIPLVGSLNLPSSILGWDVLVLNGYLLLNLHICGYLVYCAYRKRHPSPVFYIPFVFIAIIIFAGIRTALTLPGVVIIDTIKVIAVTIIITGTYAVICIITILIIFIIIIFRFSERLQTWR